MQDMSHVRFPKIPRTPGPEFATGSDPRDTAKFFQVDPGSIDSKEVPGYEGPQLDAEAGDSAD